MSKRIAFFVTCLVDQIMPDVGIAAVRLLRRAGYTVEFPSNQTCCGQPLFNSGFRDQAAKLAQRMIEIFEDYEAVVAPSGSCTTMIRAEYPHLLDSSDWFDRARALANKTYELSEFLTHQARWTPPVNPNAPRVTYHDSCHMNRMLHLNQEPRSLLAAAGCELIEMREPDRCCGFGGLFSIRMPEVSNAMTAEKLSRAQAAESDVLVTADPGCLMQMRGMVKHTPIRVEHFAVVLEEVTR